MLVVSPRLDDAALSVPGLLRSEDRRFVADVRSVAVRAAEEFECRRIDLFGADEAAVRYTKPMWSPSIAGRRDRVHLVAAASSVPPPMQPRLFLAPLTSLAACLCTLLACTVNDGDTSTSSSTATPMTDASTTAGDTAEDTGSGTIGKVTGESSSTDAPTTDAPTTGGSTDASATATTDATTDASTGPAPTDGPGVLPGETGLEAFCRRYVECGGTYYPDDQACIDESLNYWGSCPSRRTALDNFGACMSEMDCNDWSPDAYNPGSTPCAEQWNQVGASEPCN